MATAVDELPTPGASAETAEWPYRFEVVLVEDLHVDTAYQRPLTTFWQTVRDNFNPALVGTLIVSERKSGSKSIIDGQTRWTAMRELALPAAPCLIYEKLTKMDEARLFADLQTQRRAMRSYDRFRAELVAKRPKALEIAKITTDAGFELGIVETPNTVRAIAAFEYLWKFDPDHLRDVLWVVKNTWGTEDRDALQASIVRGLSHFLRHQEGVDLDRLVDRLSAITPSMLIHRASALKEGGTVGGAPTIMAEAIGNEYGRRGRRT